MQRRAGRFVDLYWVIRNWLFGWYIVEYEQQGSDRTDLVKWLSDGLRNQLGKGFPARSLDPCRKFYMTQKQIAQTVSAESESGATGPIRLLRRIGRIKITGRIKPIRRT
jgi:hypothetical protein